MSSKPEPSPSALKKEDASKLKKVTIQELFEEFTRLNDQVSTIGNQVKIVNDQVSAIGNQVKMVNDQIQIVDSKQKKVTIQQLWEELSKINEQIGVIKAQARSVNDQAQIIDSKLNVLNNRLEVQGRKEPTKKDVEKPSPAKKVEVIEPKKEPENKEPKGKKKWWQLS